MTADPWSYDKALYSRDRQVIRPTGVINRIIFASLKMNRQIHCEGDNERNAVALLEVNPDVLQYREQPPLGLSVEISGKVRQVFPDLELRYRDGRNEIVDVVRVRSLAEKDKREKLRCIGRRCHDLGYSYRVWTDLDIGRQPRLAAANSICWRGRQHLSDEVIARALAALDDCPTMGVLREVLGTPTEIICALVLQGYIAVDIANGLNDLTRVLGLGWIGEKQQ